MMGGREKKSNARPVAHHKEKAGRLKPSSGMSFIFIVMMKDMDVPKGFNLQHRS